MTVIIDPRINREIPFAMPTSREHSSSPVESLRSARQLSAILGSLDPARTMTTTTNQIGEFLERQARKNCPVTYGRVLEEFPDLPPLTGAWLSHPLCDIFGQLDAQDHAAGRPFRTALVFAKETSIPGQGFFDTVARFRKQKISKNQQIDVWDKEMKAIKAYYEAH